MKEPKMNGAERQIFILDQLKAANSPISGRTFAEQTNVSRQVIVQDVSLLKAKNEPIIATSQGYIYLQPVKDAKWCKRIIACKHKPEETKAELYAIVDCGVTIHDVRVEHPVYGDLTGILNVSSRQEVDQFIDLLHDSNAVLLSELTDGIHLHTIEAESEEKVDAAIAKLEAAGYLFA